MQIWASFAYTFFVWQLSKIADICVWRYRCMLSKPTKYEMLQVSYVWFYDQSKWHFRQNPMSFGPVHCLQCIIMWFTYIKVNMFCDIWFDNMLRWIPITIVCQLWFILCCGINEINVRSIICKLRYRNILWKYSYMISKYPLLVISTTYLKMWKMFCTIIGFILSHV